jgi:iron complex transport system substrate-binding protein
MDKVKSRSWIIIACAIFLSCGISFAREDYPRRIISLSPAMAEELYLLGAGDRLVGCTVYCQRPPEIKVKEKIGTALEVNLEKIVSLKPDLVLAISLTSPMVKEKLKKMGIEVIAFSTPSNFGQICRQFLDLGRLVGRLEEAKKIIQEAQDKVDSIRKRTGRLPHPKVLVQIGAKPLFVATSRYFINDYIEFAGGVNVAKKAKEGIYSREEVLRANPDVIIIVTMGIVGEDEKKVWKRFKTLNAAKNDRIFIVDSHNFCNPTPVSFAQTLEELVGILHSEERGGSL